jgi:hypothetical protein
MPEEGFSWMVDSMTEVHVPFVFFWVMQTASMESKACFADKTWNDGFWAQ